MDHIKLYSYGSQWPEYVKMSTQLHSRCNIGWIYYKRENSKINILD